MPRHTDREIAEALANDPEAVQRRWDAIRKIWRPLSDRIARLEPESSDLPPNREVRRKVLRYLAEHLEELGPPW